MVNPSIFPTSIFDLGCKRFELVWKRSQAASFLQCLC
ncbi:hypothetical protein F383_17701 [Gossypium arboreum]|uniref:Uncharacterized protein n=1 Tax=Gossypium arboreum TaxID=29729 RepID=A0A0B0NJN0_GOSAR|nr:hypothetical protein F383_17701 [Gossypium arboreum]